MPPLPPPNPPTQQPDDLPSILDALRSETDILERAMGGYMLLNKAYDHHVNGVPEGERKAGIPQLRHAGSVDGHKVVECIVELRKAPAQAIPSVLATVCHIHAADMLKAAQRLYKLSGNLVEMIEAALGPQPTAPAAIPAAAPAAEVFDGPIPGVDEEDDQEFEDDEEVDEVPEEEPRQPLRKSRRAQG